MGTSSNTETAGGFAAVTPHASTNISPLHSRALYVGVGGDVAVVPRNGTDAGGTAVVFKNVASGTVLPVQCLRVNATGTTATDIVALY